MSEAINFYAVRKDKLAEMQVPAGVKKFLNDFFEKRKIFGIDCLVAAESEFKKPWTHAKDEDYSEGLSKKELESNGVYGWLNNHRDVVFVYRWS